MPINNVTIEMENDFKYIALPFLYLILGPCSSYSYQGPAIGVLILTQVSYVDRQRPYKNLICTRANSQISDVSKLLEANHTYIAICVPIPL